MSSVLRMKSGLVLNTDLASRVKGLDGLYPPTPQHVYNKGVKKT